MAHFLFLFIAVPLIELALLIQVGQWIGVWSTIAIVVFTGVLGAVLAKIQGLNVINRINRELASGIMPSDALFDGFFILIGAVLLVTPGILTDLVGFILLVPQGRTLLKNWIKRKIEEAFREGRTVRIAYFHANGTD